MASFVAGPVMKIRDKSFRNNRIERTEDTILAPRGPVFAEGPRMRSWLVRIKGSRFICAVSTACAICFGDAPTLSYAAPRSLLVPVL